MNTHLALIGGEEFADGFEEVHASLLAELEGRSRRVVYLPTAAADDGAEAVEHWCALAREKLASLGAVVETPRVVDRASANRQSYAQLIAEADWIYLGGGYAHVALRILRNTRALEALEAAKARGVLVTGASAGAMMLGERSFVMTPELLSEIGRVWETPPGAPVPANYDPPLPPPLDGLGWLPQVFCAPHFDRAWFSPKWLTRGLLSDGFRLLGIDEQTALVNVNGDGAWEVRGRGAVTIFRGRGEPRRYTAGEKVMLEM